MDRIGPKRKGVRNLSVESSGRLSFVRHRKGGADYATATPLVDFVLNAYDPAGRISRSTVGLNTGLPGLANRPVVETFDYQYDVSVL